MAPYSTPSQKSYDSRTQNLLFYICAVSFMCVFVVLMVYSAIAMRRQLHNLSTEDGATNSSAARKTDVTSATTPLLFDWRHPNNDRIGGRDGVPNDNIDTRRHTRGAQECESSAPTIRLPSIRRDDDDGTSHYGHRKGRQTVAAVIQRHLSPNKTVHTSQFAFIWNWKLQ
ncbi:hypothetical protein MTO96_027505 [Rhipicephalus appendiculatus]